MVTGVAGFIGSHLAETLLQEGFTVIGLDSFTDYYPPVYKRANIQGFLTHPRFSLLESDLSKALQLPSEPVDYIFHLAAQPGVRNSWGDGFETYVDRNVIATQRLLECIRNRAIRRFIFASSSSVYGAAERFPIVETDPLRPLSPYGVTKAAAENLCFAYSREFDIPVSSLRFFSVYGPRQRPDMAFHRFMHAILQRRPITIFGSGTESRDYTYVGDVVRALIACLRTSGNGVFNIAGGCVVSLDECAEVLRQVTGMHIELKRMERQKGDPAATHADTSRARQDLKFIPAVSFVEGVRTQWEWIRRMQF
jgi:UDP-glucose 4-epimerase